VALLLYTDEDVNERLAAALRNLGHNADSFREHSTFGWSDARQLAKAIDLGRAIVTSNRKDFRLLDETLAMWHQRWHIETPFRHYGILIVPHSTLDLLISIVDQFVTVYASIDNLVFQWDSPAGWRRVAGQRSRR
jgi:hypothetical protein